MAGRRVKMRLIDILPATVYVAEPSYSTVTPVIAQGGVHFVCDAHKEEGCAGLSYKGLEATFCWGVLHSFRKWCLGRTLKEISFSGWDGERWVRVTFPDADASTKVTTKWPTPADTVSLGAASVRPILSVELDVEMPDDCSPDPFAYWWRSTWAASELCREFESMITNGVGVRRRHEPFGTLSRAFEDRIAVRWAFAVSSDVLDARCRTIEAAFLGGPAFASTVRSIGGGFAKVYLGVVESAADGLYLEPGEHVVERGQLAAWRRDLEAIAPVVQVGRRSFTIELPTDVDMSSSGRAGVLLRRGEHLFVDKAGNGNGSALKGDRGTWGPVPSLRGKPLLAS